MKTFIERDKVSINEYKGFKFSKFVLFLGLILIVSIILSGAVSAVAQGTSHNTIVPSNNLTVYHTGTVNSQTKIQPNIKTKTSNSLYTNQKQKLPDPTVIHLGVSTHYDTIALAIANSQDGDTIMLEDGATFKEHDLTIDKNLDFKVFSNGHATIDANNLGRVFTINSGIIVRLQNLTIKNGKPTISVGGAIYNSGYILTLTNCTLTGNIATDVGGAIYTSGGILNVTNCTFTSNSATNINNRGGAIFNNNGLLTVTGSTFTSNTATSNGGAIYNNYGTLTVTNSTFKSNTVTDIGGAIFNRGTLTLTGCTFTGNTASVYGGAIYNQLGSLTVTGSTFNNNIATIGRGGAIYNTGGALTTPVIISDCTFNGNTVTSGDGGAIYNYYGALTVNGCTFNGNTVTSGRGGAICIFGDTTTPVIMSGSTFTGNRAINDYGGAIYNFGALTLTGCNFSGNSATSGGGAICNYQICNVNGCNFNGNSATNGGAIFNVGALTVTGCNFSGNSAISGDGGAILNSGSATANVHFNRIIGNTATTGSAIYCDSGTVYASLNWWGSNMGTSTGDMVGTVSVTPYLVLRVTANPKAIPNGGYSIITSDLRYDNSGNLQTSGYVPDGIPVSFITSLGTIGTPSSMVNGVSHATLYSGTVSGLAYIIAIIDNQPVITLVTIDTIPPTAKTSINSGLYNTTKIVYLSMSEPGTIYYTLNGSNPTTASTKYTGHFTVSSTKTLKFLAIDLAGNKSPIYTKIYKIDKVAPEVSSTIPTNLKTGVSRTSSINIKFSENIKSSTYYNNIKVKNLTTGKYITITKAISGTYLNIKTSTTRSKYTWYQVTIPRAAIKDMAGNILAAIYTFKFKTGA